jgi:hypothetical protein
MAETKTYSEKLRDPRWQKKRLQVLERDNWTCKMCSDKETELHVDHTSYSGEPWEALDDQLQTLCKHCHKMMTDWRTIMGRVGISGIKSLIRSSPGANHVLFFVRFEDESTSFIEYSNGKYQMIGFVKDSIFLNNVISFIQNG